MSEEWNYACHQCGQARCGCANTTYRRTARPAIENDVLKLARESLALGGADVDECTVNTLARAVIAQAEELERLRQIAWTCPRCGRNDLQAQHAEQHRQSCMSRTDEEQRIDELRAALGEALDEWERSDCCWQHRIAELRRLT